jgi:cyclophilin family peptidyl-prolyl cis-trans isomerase
VKHLKLLFVVLACGALTGTARAQTSTNTIVRFTIIRGTSLLGTMDFELFDQDKPETVRNFLSYVQGGHYQNLVLQRCAPQFVLQAGEVRVSNPKSFFPFTQYLQVLNLGSISNEFNVGATQSNVYGTLAMAKVAGQTNSASTDWFINLTNNNVTTTNVASLDEQDGGYTVFGRILPGTNVVANTNVLQGTNVLEHFNHLNFNEGLISLPLLCLLGIPAFCRPEAQLFNTLPVVGQGLFIPQYSQLYYVQFKVLNPQETVRPTVVVKSPTLNQRITNETHLAMGTAADNRGLAIVYYRLNDGPKMTASGLTNWSATLDLRAGTNELDVHSVDLAGNPSTVIQRSFFRVALESLVLQTNGVGKVAGLTNGQRLEIGRGYKVTATPAPGHLFAGWTGSFTNGAAALSFLMESNLTLQANFIPNPFIPLKGVYSGLFYPTNEIAPQRSGFVTVTVTDFGRYTARVQLGAQTFPLSGQLTLEGHSSLYIFLPGIGPAYLLDLQLDLTNGTQQITGSFNDSGGTAPLIADRATFHAVTNKATNFAGKYTLLIPGAEDAAVQPGGDGFGTATIDLAGNVLFAGTLADGTTVAQRVPLSRDGRWPFYAPLYANKGSILGWITATNRETDDLNGSILWTKPKLTVKYYPLGFTNMTNVIGSRYVPMGTNRILAVTNVLLSFSGGNLTAAFSNDVTLTPPAKVTAVSTNNRLALTLTTASGLFNGTVTPPGTLKPIPFKGALLQKQTNGGGFFLGPSQGGRVTLTPE